MAAIACRRIQKQLLANYGEIPENLIEAVVESNRTRKEHITERIMSRNPECTGVYRLVMKSESDNFRQSSIIGIIQRLRNRGKKVVIYEPNLKDDYFEGVEIIKSLQEFKQISDVIIANRESPELNDVSVRCIREICIHGIRDRTGSFMGCNPQVNMTI